SSVQLEDLWHLFLETEIPEEPIAAESYADELAHTVVEHSVRTACPRFIGHMTSALPYFLRPLAQLVTALNQNLVKMETAKSLSLLEREAVARLHRLVFGLPEVFYQQQFQLTANACGNVTSGGTVANLTALWCARNRAFGPTGTFPGIERGGWPAALRSHGCA